MIRRHRGRVPVIAASAWIDESAQVIGDVTIGEESSVWMHAVVRGDVHSIRIGHRTNLQDGVIVHVQRDQYATTVGNEVTVGHGAILHGCTVHDRALVGIGAILLNGVVVGSDCIIGAGALVVERTTIPPRSLVLGSPARVRRELTDSEVASIREHASRYVGYRLDYAAAELA
jgi:carbonic anhydrase/acetyltransferase-like protein (isoleucine patch superfamily)